jgi:EAL and modified HD-GYP domain-containing signal transduction protein
MHCFVARQPIFNQNLEIYGYELLFRNSLDNFFPKDVDADQATSNIIMDHFILNNIENITEGKKAFINFTANLLLNETALHLPNDNLVIEILENVFGSTEMVVACNKLKKAGYQLALDDFVLTPDKLPLTRLANIIKVDLIATAPEDRETILRRFKPLGIEFLAEKVETQADYELAKAQGFSYFQGYFFCKPQVIQGQRLPESKANKLQLIKAVNQPEPDFRQITEIIKRDVSLTFKLLRYINSAAFGFAKEIDSIQQAVVYLGLAPLKKWVTLVALAELGDNKPTELIRKTIVRARFCELIGQILHEKDPDNHFLVGMFSHVDALMDKPLNQILEEIPLAQEIKNTLLSQDDSAVSEDASAKQREQLLRDVFSLVRAYEDAQWQTVDSLCIKLDINADGIPDVYETAVNWAHEFLATQSASSN